MLPFIEVSQLPSSSSFYSAVTQPLGLQYLYAVDPTVSPSGSHSIIYGSATSPPVPVFELRHARPTADRPLKLSRLVLSAGSPGVVRRFQALLQGLHYADGRVLLTGSQSLLRQSPEPEPPLFGSNAGAEAGKSRASTDDWGVPIKAAGKDQDGNVMEVVYVPPSGYPESHAGSTARRIHSSTGQTSRIMSWNYDVAAADAILQAPLRHLVPVSSALAPPRRPGRFPDDDDMAPVIRRTITTSTTTYEPVEPLASPRQGSNGLTTGALVGTLLGVAAASAAIGAGVAYGAMKNERGRSGFEPPMFQRRSTYPEPHPGSRSPYPEYGPSERDRLYLAERRTPPTLLTGYPTSQGPRDDGGTYEDSRSRLSSRFQPPSARSEASSSRKPLLLTEAEHRSYAGVGSKHGSSARTSEMMEGDMAILAPDDRSVACSRHTAARSKHSAAPSLRRSSTYDEAAGRDRDRDRDSYVSTRSHRTASTVRPLQATVQTELTAPSLASLASRPKLASRASGATAQRRAESYVSARETPRAGSRAATHVSARQVALPASRTGSSRIGYEEDEDDLCSIAPSDSISCVGSRKSAGLYQ